MIPPDDPRLRGIGEPGERGLILYDGECVLCSNWFRFVAQRDIEGKFLFTAIQSPYGRALAVKHGIDPDHPQSNAVLIDGTVNLRSDSAIAAISHLPGYGWVQRFRISQGSCAMPSIRRSRAIATTGSARTRPAGSAVRNIPTG